MDTLVSDVAATVTDTLDKVPEGVEAGEKWTETPSADCAVVLGGGI